MYCSSNSIHTILNSVIKDNPDGPYPSNPENDSQYSLWETALQKWVVSHPELCGGMFVPQQPISSSTESVPVEIATTTVQ
jgi:hypothetical protein